MRRVGAVCLAALLGGCMTTGPKSVSYRPASVQTAPDAAIVFVANGAGDFRTLSQNLVEVAEDARAPLRIETVDWSRGYRRVIADETDRDNHQEQGRRLALEVDAYRRTHPQGRVHLVGHSAGCAVVLAAADQLPEGSVDRIILLSPSVGSAYDLRPALRTARCGIDVFHSRRDRVVLGLGMRVAGTTDGGSRAAGQGGFVPSVSSPADAACYEKLRQHPWDPVVAWSDHTGGHFGDIQPAFLRAYVLPLLLQEPRTE